MEFDNDGEIDEGESSDDGGYANGIHGSGGSSIISSSTIGEQEFLMTNMTEDIDSMLLVGNVNEVSFDVITHATNNALDLSETNVDDDANSEFTTENVDVAEVENAPNDDTILQNDSPSLISYGHDDINIVGLGKPIGADAMYQTANDDIEIHTLDAGKKEEGNRMTSDVEQFPFIDTRDPDRIRYEVHDINSIKDNDLTHEAQSTKRILVNVSIATDNGSGTDNHAVYTLHVSVPAGPDYQIKTLDSGTGARVKESPPKRFSPVMDTSHACPLEPPPAPPCLCDCDKFCRNFTSRDEDDVRSEEEETETTVDDSFDASATEESSTNFALPSSTTDELVTEEQERPSCLESKDIPTILILEGETRTGFYILGLCLNLSTKITEMRLTKRNFYFIFIRTYQTNPINPTT